MTVPRCQVGTERGLELHPMHGLSRSCLAGSADSRLVVSFAKQKRRRSVLRLIGSVLASRYDFPLITLHVELDVAKALLRQAATFWAAAIEEVRL